MIDFESPKNAVEDMATHVADGAVAEIVPTVPRVRVKIVVPKEASADERRLYEELQRISRFNPRRDQRQ